ncbi:hypothetical protein TanjilG_11113 [Lupinus angustifolius]|uniref:Pectinesterase catalytic domain-containing protein n=1 Tax=Lupinus angustifolius TaxID=3871 RepID=A0A1J7GMJ1_LUPAN|nr:hypothetical protein TanjilG_11113 [Lupinus angustifolius]
MQLLNTKYSCKKSSNCTRAKRILEESKNQGILLNEFVIVNPYEKDNYTSIGKAIDAAPNNTRAEDGYFLIYVREGYYEEYVIVPKEKNNILLIGDVINRTVITGNHSVIDGWTTFNSSDNYTSIGKAIDAAPNNTRAEDGYFLIYVREGYYEEYVIVPKEKNNILLIGDVINRTVITGNHSVIDGWTTFNSSGNCFYTFITDRDLLS